jgi:ubiquitin carboxyl-terminal hydrolase 10
MSTQPTTPSSAAPPQQTTPKNNSSGRPNVPVLPIVPAIPNIPLPSRPSKRASVSVASEAINGVTPSVPNHLTNAVNITARATGEEAEDRANANDAAEEPIVKAAPKSWADLVRTMGPPAKVGVPQVAQVATDTTAPINGLAPAKAGSLADALTSYSVKESNESTKIAFLEPRGLVNTGNMCYMNSVSHPPL